MARQLQPGPLIFFVFYLVFICIITQFLQLWLKPHISSERGTSTITLWLYVASKILPKDLSLLDTLLIRLNIALVE